MSQSEQILASQEGVCSVELVNPDAKRPSGDLGVRNVINVCVCVCVCVYVWYKVVWLRTGSSGRVL
jgi:hypothetical protein